MPSLESRLASLEAATTTDGSRVIIYQPGEPLPEIPPGDGVVILLPDNGRGGDRHAQP